MPNPSAQTNTNSQLTFTDYMKANFMLALGKLMLVIPTQPLHVVMRRQQGALASNENPRVLSFNQAYKEIRFGQPMSALFKGMMPGTAKEFSKNLVYKGALITGAPTLAESVLPQSLKSYTSATQYHLVKCVLAGCIASVSDAVLGGPLERLATFRSTAQGKDANASYSKEFAQNRLLQDKIRFVYKGFVPTVIKGGLAFSTMFTLSQPIKQWTAKIYGLSPKSPAPWYSLGTSAILGGLAVALVSSPFDIIKTQAQMPASKGKSAYNALLDNYKLHGLRGVTAGLPAKTAMITMGWSLNFFANQAFEELKDKQKVAESPLSTINLSPSKGFKE